VVRQPTCRPMSHVGVHGISRVTYSTPAEGAAALPRCSATLALPRRRCHGGGVSAAVSQRAGGFAERRGADARPLRQPPPTSPQPHRRRGSPRARPVRHPNMATAHAHAPRPSRHTHAPLRRSNTHTLCSQAGARRGRSAWAVGLIGESKTVRPTRPRRPAWHPVRPLLVSSDPIGESEARAWHVVRAVEDELDGGLIPILEVRQELGGE